MTISSTVSRNDYVGTGALATYAYTYKIFTKNDLLVTERDTNDVESTLLVDVNYTVAGVGDASGGTITLLAGNLTSGHALTIRRVRPLTQTVDIKNQGVFFPLSHENAFDHDTMVAQQLDNDIKGSMRLPETVSPGSVSVELPFPSADKFLKWNAGATALENADLASGTTITLPGGNGIAVYTGAGTFTNRTITGSSTISVVNGTGVAGNPTLSIPPLGVTSAELAAGSVISGKIGALAVGTAELANLAVTNGKIAALAVDGAKLAANAVTSGKIAPGVVGATELANNAVTTVKILDANVTQAKLAAGISAIPKQTLVETSTQSVGNTAAETVIFSKLIPGGTIGASGSLRLKAIARASRSGNGTLTIRMRLGASGLGGTILAVVTTASTGVTNEPLSLDAYFGNKASQSSQRGMLSIRYNGDVYLSNIGSAAAVDTSVDQTLEITAQWSSSPTSNPSVEMFYADAIVAK